MPRAAEPTAFGRGYILPPHRGSNQSACFS